MQDVNKGEYFIVKALENGVQVIGLTRGTDTRFHHAEKLDEDEILVVQFTEHTSAIKIKGKAIIQSNVGEVRNDN
ncbi:MULTISPECIES: trp RNA-binding attenuation protein MtrB [Paraliobacillus]|uniref:trp RNA-binding attenuation protein MtrB n=1 Tax=Paraliobacillus TaxID=200903 RepID=UPI000DD49AA9|nr:MULTISPECIES: trp RNA-binding attenuation protein MtrB [Paraliobacillus]